MTANDQLKAELAQLAAENQRLREALQLSQMAVEQAIEEDLIPAGETGGQRDFWRHARARNYIALQTPPTPGLGAAMLQVVEAAEKWKQKWKFHHPCQYNIGETVSVKQEDADLFDAVQALNELENK